MTGPTTILCINAGSSSLKATFYDAAGAQTASRSMSTTDLERAVGDVLDEIRARKLPVPTAVGHRIVHGGPNHTSHVVLDESVRRDLEAAVPFAPLHLPPALAAVDQVSAHLGEIPQVACFDTAFHRNLPEVTRRFPLPDWVHDEGIHRYGFHGLSCEYVVAELGARAQGRTIIAHLGNGASLSAVHDGRSVDTSMGFTPTGGIVMATRTGDLDPGVLIYLARKHRLGPDDLEALVDQQGGLQGLSGTHDMEALVARRAGDLVAARAVDAFCYRARLAVGAFAAALGGLDTLVFTGGIGEHSPVVRAEISRDLAHLGIEIDPAANDAGAPTIGAGPIVVRVVPTDENRMIARHTIRLLS